MLDSSQVDVEPRRALCGHCLFKGDKRSRKESANSSNSGVNRFAVSRVEARREDDEGKRGKSSRAEGWCEGNGSDQSGAALIGLIFMPRIYARVSNYILILSTRSEPVKEDASPAPPPISPNYSNLQTIARLIALEPCTRRPAPVASLTQ